MEGNPAVPSMERYGDNNLFLKQEPPLGTGPLCRYVDPRRRLQWQSDPDRSTQPRHAIDLEMSRLQLRQLFGEEQAEPGTLMAPAELVPNLSKGLLRRRDLGR